MDVLLLFAAIFLCLGDAAAPEAGAFPAGTFGVAIANRSTRQRARRAGGWTGGDRKIQSRLVCTGYRRLSTRENHQYGFLGANNELECTWKKGDKKIGSSDPALQYS